MNTYKVKCNSIGTKRHSSLLTEVSIQRRPCTADESHVRMCDGEECLLETWNAFIQVLNSVTWSQHHETRNPSENHTISIDVHIIIIGQYIYLFRKAAKHKDVSMTMVFNNSAIKLCGPKQSTNCRYNNKKKYVLVNKQPPSDKQPCSENILVIVWYMSIKWRVQKKAHLISFYRVRTQPYFDR